MQDLSGQRLLVTTELTLAEVLVLPFKLNQRALPSTT
jgi:hypothetical protein